MSKLKTTILVVLTCIACVTVGLAIGIGVSRPSVVETASIVEPTATPTDEKVNNTYFTVESVVPTVEPTVEREPIVYKYCIVPGEINHDYSTKEIYYIGEKLDEVTDFNTYMDGHTRDYLVSNTVGNVVYEIYTQYRRLIYGPGSILTIKGDVDVRDADEFRFEIYGNNNIVTRHWYTLVIQADPFSFVIYDDWNNQTAYGDSNFYIDGITIEEN